MNFLFVNDVLAPHFILTHHRVLVTLNISELLYLVFEYTSVAAKKQTPEEGSCAAENLGNFKPTHCFVLEFSVLYPIHIYYLVM